MLPFDSFQSLFFSFIPLFHALIQPNSNERKYWISHFVYTIIAVVIKTLPITALNFIICLNLVFPLLPDNDYRLSDDDVLLRLTRSRTEITAFIGDASCESRIGIANVKKKQILWAKEENAVTSESVFGLWNNLRCKTDKKK